jgi:hypothetical protein
MCGFWQTNISEIGGILEARMFRDWMILASITEL